MEYGNGVRRRVWRVQPPDMKIDALRSCHVEDDYNFYRSIECVEFLRSSYARVVGSLLCMKADNRTGRRNGGKC